MPSRSEDERRARFTAVAREVIEPLRRYLHRRADPATAADVLSETLLTCWRRFDEMPPAHLPWAYGVARRCLANAQRSGRRRLRLVQRLRAVDPPRAESPPADAGDGVTVELRAALDRLRPAEAEVLRLWAWEDLTTSEIAAVLDVTPNAAAIRLHRAKAALRQHMRKDPDPAGQEPGEQGGAGR